MRAAEPRTAIVAIYGEIDIAANAAAESVTVAIVLTAAYATPLRQLLAGEDGAVYLAVAIVLAITVYFWFSSFG